MKTKYMASKCNKNIKIGILLSRTRVLPSTRSTSRSDSRHLSERSCKDVLANNTVKHITLICSLLTSLAKKSFVFHLMASPPRWSRTFHVLYHRKFPLLSCQWVLFFPGCDFNFYSIFCFHGDS